MPIWEVSALQLKSAERLIQKIIHECPETLDRLGERKALDSFVDRLLEVIQLLINQIKSNDANCAIETPEAVEIPPTTQLLIYRAIRIGGNIDEFASSQAWRFLLLLMRGKIKSLVLLVPDDEYLSSSESFEADKRLVGVEQNTPRQEISTLFLDATTHSPWLERLAGQHVTRLSPGHVKPRVLIIQVPNDITRKYGNGSFQAHVRGVMAIRPNAKKVGLITHSNHKKAAESLGPGFDERIHRIEYFGSGQERSDNGWYEQCDLIIICGTPRVSPMVIRQKLLQAGILDKAIGPQPEFIEYKWSGRSVSGDELILDARRYNDDDWHAAYVEQTHAQLYQAVGRGRGTLDDGVETFVMTNEPLGYNLMAVKPLKQRSMDTLQSIKDLAAVSTNNSIRKTAFKTQQVADKVLLSRRQALDYLSNLEIIGLVRKLGAGKATKWELTGCDALV